MVRITAIKTQIRTPGIIGLAARDSARLDEMSVHNRQAERLLGNALVILCFLAPGLSGRAAAQTPAKEGRATKAWAVAHQPQRLVNGGAVAFRVKAPPGLQSLRGRWLDHDVDFVLDSRTAAWWGLAGVSLHTRPGTYPLELKGVSERGDEVSIQRKFAIMAGKYRSIAVQVAKKFTEPDPEQLRKIGEDKAIKDKAFAGSTAERKWAGNFVAPVKATVSDVFGTRRTFNGRVQSTHQGLDYAAGAGTEVSAVNSATVLLARPLYFEGNCVVLDHGQGLLTLYMHLSALKVKEGEQVERGQLIGLVGGTGRATGPHLHLGVRWQGEYLDPSVLLGLRLP